MTLSTDALVREYPQTVILRLCGMFYHGLNESAYILSALTDYRIRVTKKGNDTLCGFPADTLDSVLQKLDRVKVNYVVYRKTDIMANNDFGDENSYDRLVRGYVPVKIKTAEDEYVAGKKAPEDVKTQKPAGKPVAKTEISPEQDTDALNPEQNGKTVVLASDFIAENQTECYRQLKEYLDGLIASGARITGTSYNGDKQSEHRFILSGVVVYEKL